MHQNLDYWQEKIPEELQAIPQWMVCQGPQNKAPLTLSGINGDPTDPKNWSKFADACQIAAERGWLIGFCLSTYYPYTIIDLDNKNGDEQIANYIKATLQGVNTYIERSISGLGYHMVFKGDIGKGHKRSPVEIYSRERFMIMTGDVIDPGPISSNYQKLLLTIANWCAEESEPEFDYPQEPDGLPIEDGWLFKQICDSKYHETFFQLISSRWSERWSDPSDADYAFANIMVEFTPCNQQIWDIFRTTPLGCRYKDGRARHPNSHNFLNNACRKARMRFNGWMAEKTMLQSAIDNTFDRSNILQFPRPQQPRPPLPPPQHKQFEFFGIDELLNRPPVKWVVKDMLQQGKTAILYGWSGVGKTFLILDLMEAIATGRRWFGFRTTPMPVRYFSLEGVEGLQQRVRAWEAMNQRAYPRDGNVAISETNLDLVRDRDALIDSVGMLSGVIIIDTLAEALGGRSENKSEDMQPVTDAAKYLAGHTNSAVVVIHHSTKPDAKTGETTGYPRGWGGLYANFDADIEIGYRGAEDEFERFVYAEKVKDGHSKWTRNFTLIRQALGTDEYGDMIESLAVRYDEQEVSVNQYGEAEVDKPWEGEEKKSRGRSRGRRKSKEVVDAPMGGEKSERAFRTSLNEKTLISGWKELVQKCGNEEGWVPYSAVEDYMLQHIAGERTTTRRATLGRVLEKLQGMGKLECKPGEGKSQLLRMKHVKWDGTKWMHC